MGIFGRDDRRRPPPAKAPEASAEGKKRKPAPDFSNVVSGGSSTAPPPATPAPVAPAQRTYTVRPGDSLWKIAKRHYGDGNRWKRLYEANRETIGANPDLIHPGQVLVIPEL